ncbi:HAD-IIB family hydrolase [Leucothrix sargassi]|nr:HAD-IIB family hydrolase [Leucothrix sargassi]
MRKNYIVFTDLDGTLLDHHSYTHAPAQPALDLLASLDVPVILNSSKTLKEIEHIASGLKQSFPRIAENGSLVADPSTDSIHTFGGDYKHICLVLEGLRNKHDYKFVGFHDWTPEQLAEDTGLPLDAATRAGARQGSEPIRWEDTDERLEQFRAELDEEGLTLNRGGRYWHVMWQADKAQAMEYLVRKFAGEGERPTVIALGDGPNDRNMLAAADIAVIVHNPDGVVIDLPEREGQQVIRTTLPGPSGWNEAIQQIINT